MTDLTKEAIEGFDSFETNTTNPYLWSSPCWFGFMAGKALYARGMCKPIKASMGRGYSVKLQTAANDFVAEFEKKTLIVSLIRK